MASTRKPATKPVVVTTEHRGVTPTPDQEFEHWWAGFGPTYPAPDVEMRCRAAWQAAQQSQQAELREREDLLYTAWTIIANACGGNWENAPMDWQKAAEKWRDRWHAALAPSSAEEEG